MLKCKQITEQASRYLDGDLGRWRRVQYLLHLLMCGHCRTFVHNFKAGILMMRRVHQQRDHQPQVDKVCRHVRSCCKE